MAVYRIKNDDRLLSEMCSICLEGYQVNIWLLKNRHCPLCKLDVLKATGYQVNLFLIIILWNDDGRFFHR